MMFRALVFLGVGLSEQETGLWWLLAQRARNMFRLSSTERTPAFVLVHADDARRNCWEQHALRHHACVLHVLAAGVGRGDGAGFGPGVRWGLLMSQDATVGLGDCSGVCRVNGAAPQRAASDTLLRGRPCLPGHRAPGRKSAHRPRRWRALPARGRRRVARTHGPFAARCSAGLAARAWGLFCSSPLPRWRGDSWAHCRSPYSRWCKASGCSLCTLTRASECEPDREISDLGLNRREFHIA